MNKQAYGMEAKAFRRMEDTKSISLYGRYGLFYCREDRKLIMVRHRGKQFIA
jgi:hypothetical protein